MPTHPLKSQVCGPGSASEWMQPRLPRDPLQYIQEPPRHGRMQWLQCSCSREAQVEQWSGVFNGPSSIARTKSRVARATPGGGMGCSSQISSIKFSTNAKSSKWAWIHQRNSKLLRSRERAPPEAILCVFFRRETPVQKSRKRTRKKFSRAGVEPASPGLQPGVLKPLNYRE